MVAAVLSFWLQSLSRSVFRQMVFLLDVRVALGSRSLCLVGKLAELFPIRETFLCLISRQFDQIVCATVSPALQLVVEYLLLRQQLR